MVLAYPVDIESHLVGEFNFLEKIAQPLGAADDLPRSPVGTGIREAIDAEFQRRLLFVRRHGYGRALSVRLKIGTCATRVYSPG